MALLITQDQHLIPLNNRQYCRSGFRGGADHFITGLHKIIHAIFSNRISNQFGLESKGYKDFKIAGIKGLSKIAQEYRVLLGMFLCQKNTTHFICCSCLYCWGFFVVWVFY